MQRSASLRSLLKLVLCSYRSPQDRESRDRRRERLLNRLDVSKQIFGSFVNRIHAYDYATHLGLITFQSKPKVTQHVTGIVENFRHSLNEMTAQGDTALWDALALASDQLEQHSRVHPQAAKRIVCLSDGRDTKSKRQSDEICRKLLQRNTVLDSFSLGNEDNKELRAVSYLTGGYVFVPKDLESAMAICEMEPFQSQLERPPIARPHQSRSIQGKAQALAAAAIATPEIVTRDEFPQRKQHPNLEDSFFEISELKKQGMVTCHRRIATRATRAS